MHLQTRCPAHGRDAPPGIVSCLPGHRVAARRRSAGHTRSRDAWQRAATVPTGRGVSPLRAALYRCDARRAFFEARHGGSMTLDSREFGCLGGIGDDA